MNDAAIRKPVKVSGTAHRSLAYYMRQWTGWGDKATLVLGEPGHSPYAECLHDPVFTITVNPETLVLNPNRVLNTVTPFRLRQEAVLTGALLHEAGHARHSHWQPGRYGNPEQAVHSDGAPVKPLTLNLAKVAEEARVEGLIAAEAATIGARGLAWTMRCSAIKVLPFTEVDVDPDQAVLDVVCSWLLRAGRQISTAHHVIFAGGTYALPKWVQEFNVLLGTVLDNHLDGDSDKQTHLVTLLYHMVTAGAEADAPGSTFMVDKAREVLDLLFPPEKQDDLDTQGGCPEDQSEDAAPDEEDSSEDESGEQDSDEGEDQAGDAEPGDGDSDDEADADDTGGTSDEDGEDGEGDTEPEDEGSGSEPGAGDTGTDDAEPSETAANQAEIQEALSEIEQAAVKQANTEQREEMTNPSESMGAGENQADEANNSGDPSGASGGRGVGQLVIDYRSPDKGEREVKTEAATFLRNIIDPSEVGKMQITDSPSATVDGAALAAWKAGGQKSDPRFFKRIRRTDAPAPPVKIAILVDVSASMDVLQAPSALLSWALSSACLDLRNFAGRGVQIESTLIHWGSSARVIQANGSAMPGIHQGECNESTSAMDHALDLVAEQLPGFFQVEDHSTNRLLVQFTDWELAGWNLPEVTERIDKALASGVNMLSVVPMDYSWRRTRLDDILASVRNPVGRTSLLKYDPARPNEVWTAASEVLSGVDNNYGF